MPSLEDTSEWALIRAIKAQVGSPPAGLLGIGDDAAVGTIASGNVALTTTDMLVEGVHFRQSTTSPRDLGHKALAVNLSDIAAMGGKPAWAVVALALPGKTELAWVQEFYAGLLGLAKATGTALVGGDTVRASGGITIAITVVGESVHPLKRTDAQVGDGVFMTGPAGLAAAGLWCLEHPEASLEKRHREKARLAHVRPQPQLAAGQTLANGGYRVALLDNSDGLARSASLLAEASQVDLILDATRFPSETATQRVAAMAKIDVVKWVLEGGEDYGLVGCVAPADWPEVASALARVRCRGVLVGEVVSGSGRAWVKSPTTGLVPISDRAGFDHFAF